MEHQDWICSVKWVQTTPGEGAWHWTMWLVGDTPGEVVDKPKLEKLAEGVAFWKITVYWKVWRACRKNGLTFRPNVRGTIEDD